MVPPNGNVEKTQGLIDEYLTTGKYVRVAQYGSLSRQTPPGFVGKRKSLIR